MRKIFLFSTLIALALASCKKTDTSSSSTTTLATSNASAVSAALKVWHGTNVQGTAPSGTNGSLQIDQTAQELQSYKGGYAVIQPNVLNGTVAGYYLHVNGASNYFKVDFSKSLQRPAFIGQRPATKSKHAGLFFRPAGDSSTYDDSLIVIQLPANIDTGTFCMEYWAYDNSGNISDSASVCITVNQLGATDSSEWAGNWKLTAFKNSDQPYGSYGGISDTSWYYNPSDSTNIADYVSGYYCVNGYLSDDSTSYYDQYGHTMSGTGEPILIPEYLFYPYVNLTLSANGAWLVNEEIVYKGYSGIFGEYQCNDIPYNSNDTSESSSTGGWSYNATKNIFTIMSHETDGSVEYTNVEQLNVILKTATQFTIQDSDGEAETFNKQ